MQPEDMSPDPEAYLDEVSAQSNWSLFGAKLWWMLTARTVLRVWPSKEQCQDVLNKRKGRLHEELRVRIARQQLAEDGDL